MSIEEIGCCGAYCGTCNIRKENRCQGCKLGYSNQTRDISRAKCKMKVCCIQKRFSSCADCDDYDSCDTIQGFHNKGGYKYKKYKEAINFIRTNGYEEFVKIADGWRTQYGKYE
jgi:hypothetical protein